MYVIYKGIFISRREQKQQDGKEEEGGVMRTHEMDARVEDCAVCSVGYLLFAFTCKPKMNKNINKFLNDKNIQL